MSRPFSFVAGLGLLLAVLLCAAGCGREAPASPGLPPPTVTVSYPIQREVTDFADYPGRTAAVESVQVRARVTGYLDKIYFKEGAEVEQDEVLYEIDPRPYQAALDQAQAQVTLQEAQLKYQDALYRRDLKLVGSGAVSAEEVQKDLAARNTTGASLNAAKAAVEQAKLNLGFTKVRAPVRGRIGRTLLTLGNLVVADQTVLTSLVSLDPIYAYFDVDERTMLRVQQLIREGKFKSAREPGVKVPVYLGLSTERDFPHVGYVDFINNQVSPGTGTLQVRGVFANPKPSVGDRVLTPGLYVRIRVPVSMPYQALLVVASAVGTDQNVKYIYVLDDDNRVVRRDVQLGSEQDGLVVIAKGLDSNDRVVVNGLQHVRPGMVVNPKLTPMPAPPRELAAPAPPKMIQATGKEKP